VVAHGFRPQAVTQRSDMAARRARHRTRAVGVAHEARRRSALDTGVAVLSEREPVGMGLYPRPRRRAAPPRSANRRAKTGTVWLTDGPHVTEIFEIKQT
jgi:hypothetical protein